MELPLLLYGVAEVAVKKTSREVLLGWLVAAFVILLKQLRGAGRFQIARQPLGSGSMKP